ncbi:MAG: hypothetical protein IH846_18920 [Acidobacteria bacterium]|nr:hypothetical protein [Acidobacteriota bacterium]
MSIANTEMRPEAPPGRVEGKESVGRSPWSLANRACHRSEISDGSRTVRIKQFLYDFAPPAVDHPSLWQSSEVRPFLHENTVGWLGTDYRQLPAASIHLYRTMVELSVTTGTFADEELISLVRGLRPTVPAVFQCIESTPLAVLCYENRHSSEIISVPIGYWAHRREPSSMQSTVLLGSEAPPQLIGRAVQPSKEYECRLDTVFIFGDVKNPQEIEYVYDHRDRPGQYIRILVWRTGTAGSLPYPPVLDRQPCSHEVASINGRGIYHAFFDPRYGPHEAVWEKDGLTFMLLAKPAPWTDAAWFASLLRKMV